MAPRPHTPKSRGRRNLPTSQRQMAPRNNPDDTYQDRSQKKRKGGAKTRVSGVTKAYRKKNGTSTKAPESSSDEGSSDEADVEDADEDDPEPAVTAPSHAIKTQKNRAAGRYHYQDAEDTMSDANDSDNMFVNDKAKGVAMDDDDENDDEIYRGVEDISDSDPNNVSENEEAYLETELNLMVDPSGLDDGDPSSFYLNQIEGMSAYGFGDNDDADDTAPFHMSSPSSDNDDVEVRRIRFETSFPEQHNGLLFHDSPTIGRALLPSALPHTAMAAMGTDRFGDESDVSSDFDSDVTEDCLPAAAVYASDMEDYIPEESSPSDIAQSKLREGKGPPTGTFIDEGEKSAGTLDATGKMLIITNPHHLGEEFARRYGGSATPSVGFAEAVFGDEDSQSTTNNPNGPIPDPMPSSLNGNVNLTSNGQAIGPPEAWYADASTFTGKFNHGEVDLEGLDAGEQQMRLEDVIFFDGDDDEDDDDDDDGLNTSPVFMSSNLNGTPRDNLAHLNTNNVMAFRRGTDPAFAGFQSSPPAPQRGYFATPKPSRSARKRKKFSDSPYSTPLYRGVTPIQRTARSSYSTINTGDATSPLKRRRTMV